MPPINVSAIDTTQVQQMILMAVKLLKPVATATKTTVDDQAIALVEQLANSPIFPLILQAFLGLLAKQTASTDPAAVGAAFHDEFAKVRESLAA